MVIFKKSGFISNRLASENSFALVTCQAVLQNLPFLIVELHKQFGNKDTFFSYPGWHKWVAFHDRDNNDQDI